MLFAYLTTSNYDFKCANTLKPTTTTTTLAPYTPHLTCKLPFPRSYDKTHGVRPRRNVRQAMKTEVSMYACVQVSSATFEPHAPKPACKSCDISIAKLVIFSCGGNWKTYQVACVFDWLCSRSFCQRL